MPTASTAPVVRVDRVNYFFGEDDSRNQVLFHNCLEIGAGQLTVMTGPSGSGKTTLLTLIGALRSLQDGEIEVFARSLAGRSKAELVETRRHIGFIFQMHNLFDALSAYENVKMAMQLGGCPSAAMRERGTAVLERLGLGHRIDYHPRALSGGQRQRVAIARALVNRPKLILADEPTAALDKDSSRIVVQFLKELAVEDGSTIIMVTHDNRILDVADRIVNMVDGRIVSDVMLSDAVIVCEFLKTVELFKNLSPADLTHVAERMTKRHYAAGEFIIHEGEVGEEFFLLVEGRVAVTRLALDGSGRTTELATLGRGDFFGEAALITGGRRNATVRAIDEIDTYVLDMENFRVAIDRSASFKDQLVRAYFQRQ
jgi:putative ABC transport system ATP-binding protein